MAKDAVVAVPAVRAHAATDVELVVRVRVVAEGLDSAAVEKADAVVVDWRAAMAPAAVRAPAVAVA